MKKKVYHNFRSGRVAGARSFSIIALIWLILLLSAAPAAAQEQCEIGLSAAPAFFNLKLGMSPPEAERAVGGELNIDKIKDEGVYFRSYIKKDPPAVLRGVRTIYLRFFTNKLYQIEIFYEATGTTLEEFIRRFSARENIPFDTWQIKYGIAELACDGFSAQADNFLNPRIELTDDAIRAEFQKKEEDKKKKKKESQ